MPMMLKRPRQPQPSRAILAILLWTLLLCCKVECGWYHAMANAMGWNDGWESKGITFGLKSKGMTAIIPIPLPIPIFSKDKGDSGGGKDSGGGDMKGVEMAGGWDMPPAGGDWW